MNAIYTREGNMVFKLTPEGQIEGFPITEPPWTVTPSARYFGMYTIDEAWEEQAAAPDTAEVQVRHENNARLIQFAPHLLMWAVQVVNCWESGDLTEAVNMLRVTVEQIVDAEVSGG